jgi:phage terminase large subunit-like protein
MSKKQHPYLKKLIDYSKDVINGEVVACEKHTWACLRFLSDVDRVKNDHDFEYEFDGDRAEQFSKWCGIFKHTKGVLAGENIELAPIGHFIFGNIYGWYSTKTGYRRFTKYYWQVARKNAKSQYISLQSAFELFVFPKKEVSEVYCAATKTEQANIVYNEAKAVIESCELLKKDKHYRTANKRLTRVSNGSFMRPLSKDDAKRGDGLNPQFGAIDEYHAHETSEVLDILDSAQISRAEPLLGIITTAGFELNNPCYRVEYDLIEKILNPNKPTNVESYFVMVNELDRNNSDEPIVVNGKTINSGELIDDINDPNVWIKSNPIAASYDVGRDKIKKRLELALEAPEKMRDFMTKTMNVWVNERSFGYMNMDKWAFCGVERDKFTELLEKNTDKNCYVGLDLSAKLDLTSATFEFRGNDDKYYVCSHSFIPESKAIQKGRSDNVPYELWEKNGWLTVTPGDVVDYRYVKKYVMDRAEKNDWYVEEIDIDPYGATQLATDFQDDGIEVVEVRQGFQTLSEPTKDFRYMVYDKRVVHDNNPVLAWAMGNAVTRTNHNECIMLDKSKAKQRIDPAASTINAHVRAMINEHQPQNRVFVL